MKVNNLPEVPEGCLLKFPAADGWAELYKSAESLEVEFASDGKNVRPCIILGTDSDKKIAFPLDDEADINALIMRLKLFKNVIARAKSESDH